MENLNTKKRTGYYQADNINGVMFYGKLMEDSDVDIIPPKDFFESLDTLDDDEIIYTFIGPEDAETLATIESEYGIN